MPTTTPAAVRLHRTECMTFPRSGHGVLQKLLHRYFEPGVLVYCESYRDLERGLDYDPRTNFQKNHDLELSTPVLQDRHYLVQVRYPIESLVSWYRLQCENGEMPDAPEMWVQYALHKASFWMRFYRKWVLDHVPNRLIVDYADLVSDPASTVARVVEFMTDDEADPRRVRASCEAEGVARRSHHRNFKYYGPEFFALLKGLFAAVPGVDIEHDTLVVPSAGVEADPLRAALPQAVHELRRAAEILRGTAERLSVAGGGGNERVRR